MRLLLSLCNANQYNSQFSLAVVDTASGESRLVDCSAFLDFKADGGVTGLCRFEGGLALAVQSASPRIVLLDDDLHTRWVATDPRLVDVHSLAFHDGKLFAMSSGRNKILEIDARTGKVGLFWEYERSETPFLHVNSLAFHDGRAVVCSHKLPPEANHRSETGGCWRLDDLEVLIDGLKAPHTLTALDGALVCLSSADGRVAAWRKGKLAVAEVPGYLRGMLMTGRETYLGCSALRFISRKSPGVKRYADFRKVVGNPAYMSSLVVCDGAFREKRRIPTTHLAFEIYDLAADPGVPDAWLAERSTAVRMQTMQRLTVTLREQLQALRRAGEEAEQEAEDA
jgi:hypothetical protein